MAILLTGSLVISALTITTVLGCGVMPPGQATSRNFTVAGFSLTVSMAYSDMVDVRTQVPGIATSSDAAQTFVLRLVMQTVFDVLERQGRSAGLPDALIAAILGQLTVQISYEALECKKATVNHTDPTRPFPGEMDKLPHCIVFGNTVSALCTAVPANGNCDLSKNENIITVPSNHMSISGALKITNVVMANWSREMWQNVVNRAVQILASGPFGSHFFSAYAAVS
ncbi:hypothetical protein KIN20_034094 [Parelaphostrongylus tenuis]|uniref:Uncharacterized protein n=1 Tax=Parelaphostrongylus tenuis TaxID=148309 RepID=A0AAD5WIZ3_PARTN|nr:hypothetical protein KIN20_034094 [Parelaphostrongylus tenuis]